MRHILLISLSLTIASTCSAQDGALDPTFTPGTGPNSAPFGYVELASGKLLVVGAHTSYDGVTSIGASRITQDGVLDPTFDVGTGTGGFGVSRGTELADGRVFIVGGFLNFGGAPEFDGMALLLPNGSPDTSFHTSGVTADIGYASVGECLVQPDGKIMIAGRFDRYNGVTRSNIARINPDGSLDMSFDPGLGTGNQISNGIKDMVLLPDGKLMIVGRFATYNGEPRKGVARINPDGSLDTSFNAGTAANTDMNACAVQQDGKVLVGGNFLIFAGVEGNKLVRLNADGSVDPAFNAGSSATGDEPYGVSNIALQGDGKIIISGRFDSFFDGSAPYVARLMPDGSEDPTFVQGTGLNNWVRSIHLQPSGKLLVATYATEYNGTTIGQLIRLTAGSGVGVEEVQASGVLAVYPNPTRDEVRLPVNYDARSITLLDALGRPALRAAYEPTLQLGGLPSGVYVLVVHDAQGREIARAKIVRDR